MPTRRKSSSRAKIKRVVIPAAGLGTRFLPFSKAVPKEMLPIVDKPSIQYIVEEAVASGIEEVILITSRGKSTVEDHFDISYELEDALAKRGKIELLKTVQGVSRLVRLISVRQKEPLGLGHAVLCAREVLGDEPFAVILPDDLIDSRVPCIKQLIKTFSEYGKAVVALEEVPDSRVHLYGIVRADKIRERLYRVKHVVEKPKLRDAPSNLAVIGRYVLPPEILKILAWLKPGKGGEIQLTDALQELARRKMLYGYKFRGIRYDSGDKLGFLQANVVYGLKRPDLKESFREFLRKEMNK